MAGEGIEQHAKQLDRRRVRGDVVRRREQEAFQRGSRGQLQPRVVGDQLGGRVYGQRVELGHVHPQRGGWIDRVGLDVLELGHHLLDPQPLAEGDADERRDHGRLDQNGDDLVDREGPAHDVPAYLEVRGHVPFNCLEHEGSGIGYRAGLDQLIRDLPRRLAGVDDDDDGVLVLDIDRLRETGAQLTADDLRDERQLQRGRVVRSPADDAVEGDRSGHEIQPADDEPAQQEREDREAEEVAAAARSTRAVVALDVP